MPRSTYAFARANSGEAPTFDRSYHGIAARLDRLPNGSWQNRLAILLSCVIFCGGFSQYAGSGMLTLWIDLGWSTSELNTTCVASTMFGYLVGSIIMGFISDIQGRRIAILISVAMVGLCSLAAVFTFDMFTMIFVRLIAGIGMGGCILSSYCVLAEYTPPHSRGRYAAQTGLIGSLSLPLSTLCTMWVSTLMEWRVLCVIGFALGVAVFILIHRLFPESPRWLASQGRFNEADAITAAAEKSFLEKGVKLDAIDLEQVARATASTARPVSPARMLRHPVIIRRIIVLGAALFAMNFLVYSVTAWTPMVFVANGMPSTLSLALSFVIGLGAPFGIFMLMIFADKHGRKVGLVVSLLVVAAASYVWSSIPVNNAVAMMLFGFLLCSVLYYYSLLACSVYIGELFPTCIRARCAGFANAIGRIASIITPYLMLSGLSSEGIGIVYTVSAVVCVVAALLVGLFGAETRYRTLEDINDRFV